MRISLEEFKSQIRSDYRKACEKGDIYSVVSDRFCNANDIRTDNIAEAVEKSQSDGSNIVVCTTESLHTGWIWEAISINQQKRLPLSIIALNNGLEQSNASIIKMLNTNKGAKNTSIVSVRGDDYAALCQTLEKQFSLARNSQLSITIIDECNKSVEPFANWIVEKGIETRDVIDKINSELGH